MTSLKKWLEQSKTWLGIRERSAGVAKDRLQIIIAHERGERENPDYLVMLQQDLLEVIAKYVAVDPRDIRVQLERQDHCSVLELNITLPRANISANVTAQTA